MLQIDTNQTIHLTPKMVIGESMAVLGIRGSGKTNTAAVLIEELLPVIPLTIVDIEGEYWGLKEKFPILVAGHSPNVDVAIAVEQAAALAAFSITHNLSLVLDVSEFEEEEREAFLLAYFKSLWDAAFIARKPHQIVLEEAHEFVPQGQRTELKKIFTRISLRGRKRGLGLICVSQRSAKVEKDILTQASILFLHRVRHPIDIKVYQDIIPLPPAQVEQMITQLDRGQAIVLYGHEINVASIRLRDTFHVGHTPQLEATPLPTLLSVDTALLEELRTLTGNQALTIPTRTLKPTSQSEKDVAKPKSTARANMTDSITAFRSALRDEDTSAKTIASYLGDLATFTAWYQREHNEALTPSDITTITITSYRAALQEAGRKPATINRHLITLKRFCRWLIDAGHLEYDPARPVKLIPSIKSAPRHFTDKEEAALVRAVEKYGTLRDRAIIITMLHTGLRAAEVCSLTKDDLTIHPRSGTLRIQGKRNKYRTVPLNNTVRQVLRDYLSANPNPSPYVFPGARYEWLGTRGLAYLIEKYGRLATIEDLTPHDLRHRFGYRMAKTTRLDVLAQIMGHDNINTTAIYTQPTAQDLQKAVDTLAWE